jgi:hypothetical protein
MPKFKILFADKVFDSKDFRQALKKMLDGCVCAIIKNRNLCILSGRDKLPNTPQNRKSLCQTQGLLQVRNAV